MWRFTSAMGDPLPSELPEECFEILEYLDALERKCVPELPEELQGPAAKLCEYHSLIEDDGWAEESLFGGGLTEHPMISLTAKGEAVLAARRLGLGVPLPSTEGDVPASKRSGRGGGSGEGEASNGSLPYEVGEDPHALVFAKEGEVWRICFGGTCRSLPHRRGLGCIQALLRRQGEDVRVEDLSGHATLSRGEETLDPRARKELEERLHQLRVKRERNPSPPDAMMLGEEIEKLETQLKADTGLGGRARRIGNDRGAAASAAGHAIRRAIQQMREAGLVELASHLDDSIKNPSGNSPSYRPAKGMTWLF